MEQHSGDFSVTVRDVRQLTQPESDLLTLLWVLEGSVNLAVAEGASQPLVADGLAIVNRNRRWSLRSAGANAVMILTLPGPRGPAGALPRPPSGAPARPRGPRRVHPHPLRQLAGPPR